MLPLTRVCADAKTDGFDYVEGYPNSAFLNEAEDYMGPLAMYKSAGLTGYYSIKDKLVMIKKL